MLSAWVIFTFTLFSLSRSKLPAYILPIFPALAVMMARRFFSREDASGFSAWPAAVWKLCLVSSLALSATIPLVLAFVFHDALPGWMNWQPPVAVGAALLLLWLSRRWRPPRIAAVTLGLAWLSLLITAAEIPRFEISLRGNQTLEPLGAALRENCRPGDSVVCWGRLPQGLPFYAAPVISATHRAYFGGMPLNQVPFAFPGNRERLGKWFLPDDAALAQLLGESHRVWVVGFAGTVEQFQRRQGAVPLRLFAQFGQWELFVNQQPVQGGR